MRKYECERGIIYISKPNKQQVENIRRSTIIFLKQVIKERVQNGHNRPGKRVSCTNSNKR